MTATRTVNTVAERANDKGGTAPTAPELVLPEDVRITMSIPGELTAVIDRLRKPTKTSRRTWLLQAAYEKLKRDGEI
jgi:hypothetical protein